MSTSGTTSTGRVLPGCRELSAAYAGSLHIQEQIEAIEAALPDRPGTVFTFCRSIVETVCRTVLTDRGCPCERSWEAPKLFKETLRVLRLAPDGEDGDDLARQGFEKTVRGLNSLVDGIVEIRNAEGTGAHGRDAYARVLSAAHAEFVASATDTLVVFLYRVHRGLEQIEPSARLQYERQPEFNEFIDTQFGPFSVLEVDLVASEALFHTDPDAYRELLTGFRETEVVWKEAQAMGQGEVPSAEAEDTPSEEE